MTRFLLLTLLSACTTQEDLSRFKNRNPAMRTLDYGNVFALGTTTLHPTAMAAGDDRAFLLFDGQWRGAQCTRLEIFRIQDVESDVRLPSQIIDDCDGEGPEDMEHFSYASSTLLLGSRLYVDDGNGELEFESDLRGLVPIVDALTNVYVIDGDHLLLSTRRSAYLMERESGSWVNSHRFPQDESYTLGASEGVLLIGQDLYTLQGHDWEILNHPNFFSQLQGDHVLDVSNQSHRIDGTEITLVAPSPGGPTPSLLTSGIAMVRSKDLVVTGLDFSAPRRDAILPTGWRIEKIHTRGDSIVVSGKAQRQGNQHHWIQVTDRTAQGGTLSAPVEVARDEISSHSFVVDPDARRLTVVLSGTGDADLYVRYEQAPTRTEWDCAPYRMGSAEICTFPNPEPGEWFVDVIGFEEQSEVLVTAQVD